MNRAIENNNHYSRISNALHKCAISKPIETDKKTVASIEIDVSKLKRKSREKKRKDEKNEKQMIIKRKLVYLDLLFIIKCTSKSSSQEINPVIKSFFQCFHSFHAQFRSIDKW